MKKAKQIVRQILDDIPEDATLEDIQYHIYVQEKINNGLRDIEEGRVIDNKEIEKRMMKWLNISQ